MSPKARGCPMKLLRFSICRGICASQRSGGILNKFENSIANDAERILQIHVCVVDELIRPRSKSGAYLVEKG